MATATQLVLEVHLPAFGGVPAPDQEHVARILERIETRELGGDESGVVVGREELPGLPGSCSAKRSMRLSVTATCVRASRTTTKPTPGSPDSCVTKSGSLLPTPAMSSRSGDPAK